MASSSIYLLPDRIQKARLKIYFDQMKKAGIKFNEKFDRNNVDIIVTEYATRDQVLSSLKKSVGHLDMNSKVVVTTKWLSECLKAGGLIDIEDHHQLSSKGKNELLESPIPKLLEYACQRSSPLKHKNDVFVRAFRILSKHAEFRFGVTSEQQYYAKALAFNRAAAVLISMPKDVKNLTEIQAIRHLGKHATRIVEDILNYGKSDEVAGIHDSLFYKTMEVFTNVYGVGPTTANQWYEKGWKSVSDVDVNQLKRNDLRIFYGLSFYDDLVNQRVTKVECDWWDQKVKHYLSMIDGDFIVTVCGGFRRGKSDGHDIDILISHRYGKEVNTLKRIISALYSQDLVLHGIYESDTFRPEVLTHDFKSTELRSTLDHFEKWLGIVKFPQQSNDDEPDSKRGRFSLPMIPAGFQANYAWSSDYKTISNLSKSPRDWIARRVDLIVVPYHQYFYALVGWTGNRHFNRDTRLYAQKELNMKLSSHGLVELKTGKVLPARTEEEVFANLQLPWLPPSDRNC